MLNRLARIIGSIVICSSVALNASAQSPGTAQSSTAQTSATEKKLHVAGCVFPKKALTASAPVAVYPGSVDDYILSDTKVISASPGLTSADNRIFTLMQVDQERLRSLIGKRVSVSARVSDTDQLPQLQVISLIETVGSCPIRPTSSSD